VADVAPASPAERPGCAGDKVLRIGGQDARDQQTQVNEIVSPRIS
jgi:S1-C subfamily serine protease